VIESAEEFVRLRNSEDPEEYGRAAHEAASEDTWHDVIARFPDMRFRVAQNKTVPLNIREELRNDADEQVRSMVRAKGTWKPAHPEDFKGRGTLSRERSCRCPRHAHAEMSAGGERRANGRQVWRC
jgi:hypothetical protein